jgi:hypothetical protein
MLTPGIKKAGFFAAGILRFASLGGMGSKVLSLALRMMPCAKKSAFPQLREELCI